MSKTYIQSYLFFGGRCEEAVKFYEKTLGAKVEMLLRFKESPEPPPPGMVPDGYEDKIMHAEVRIGDSVVMASDGCGESKGFEGFSLSLSLPAEDDVRRTFDALAEGGKVEMPVGKTFWSPCFGMLTDKFGLGWMLGVAE